MGFLGVYKAVYDYAPQGEAELAISDGDVLYILSKSGEDGWWKAKKKASGDDDDEPEGLIPNNYVEEAHPLHNARALYDYTRQTDEELSFTEDAHLEVFDNSDPDWILVGSDGEYGFVPANYIDVDDGPASTVPQSPKTLKKDVATDYSQGSPEPSESPVQNPAAALAGIIQRRASIPSAPPPALALPPRPQYTPEASDEDEDPTPALPARPGSQTIPSRTEDYATPRSPASPGIAASPPHNRISHRNMDEDVVQQAPGGFHMYNVNEMVSVMGKRKKMPTTLGINLGTGKIMIAPEKAKDGPQQEWTAEKMTHYSIEGKHVFLEMVRPSKSVDLHAGAKDTAEEIVSALGELAGAVRAEGLREVIMAGSGHSQKTGQILYDFMAQGDDEVTVAVGDEVIIVDDSKSEEWWQVRRLKNGKEGVVPSSYIEITGLVPPQAGSSGINAGRSTVEQNRLEEQRLTKESARAQRAEEDSRGPELGSGVRLPERGSSLAARENESSHARDRRESRSSKGTSGSSKTKPDVTKVRTWNDRSKSFSVDAQFLALKDGKINLHKMNGVKIAVPVAKMSIEDLDYVERITGISLDEDKPLSELKKSKQQQSSSHSRNDSSSQRPSAGAAIEPSKKPEYDWFQFFLSCDVGVGLCERYTQRFDQDSMDESVLPDVDAGILRNLGIREGDIIKIMRFLDKKYGRSKNQRNVSFGGLEVMGNGDGDGDGSPGGLFSGPGGALRNNTRKGRPAPAVQTSDVIDPKAFAQKDATDSPSKPVLEGVGTPLASAPKPVQKDVPRGGFDDDAWDVKPSRQSSEPTPSPAPQASSVPPPAPKPTLTGSMQELSLLSAPLEPTRLQNPSTNVTQPSSLPPVAPHAPPPQQQQLQQQQQPQPQISQPTGATPSFFGIGQQQTGMAQSNTQFSPQQSGYGLQQPTQQSIARQRPVAPQYTQNQNSLVPPPPQRPLSAPQSAQQSGFATPPQLQPQMTGVPNGGYQSPSQVAPPGQSLSELNQMRMQQQQQQQQMQQQMPRYGSQQNGSMMPQPTGFGQFNNGMQQPNTFGQQQQQFQPQQTGFQTSLNGNSTSNLFSDSRAQQFSPIQQQPTGFQSSFSPPPQQYPQQTGINSFLQPALQPQQTGLVQPQATGLNGFGQQQGFVPPPLPPMPQQQTMAPLQPQKTGPPPPVRFGVTGDTKKLMPQATGRRANLAQATPQNPFGF